LDRKDVLPESAITLAEAFKQQGYQTFGVTTNGNAGASFGFAQGFDAFVYPKLKRSYPGDVTMFPAEGVTNTALDWLKGRPADSPFFLFLHYTDPHDAYLPHEGLLPEPEPRGRFDGSRKQLRKLDYATHATDVDRERIKYLYAGEVKYCDLWIGKLIEGLRDLGVWDDVMFVVTADHGEGLWDHGLRAHGRDLYEEMVRIPLLVRYPGMSSEDARRIAPPVSLVNLAPTLLAAAEIAPPAEFRGRDLWPLISGNEHPDPENGIYTELALDGLNLEAVRTASHKLVRDRARAASDDGAYALFDLSSDAKERHNLMAPASETAARLRATLSTWRIALANEGPATRPDMRFDQLSESDLDSMKALGYLDDEEHREALLRKKAEKRE
jgi:arylsulfatase A-like enzyme